MPKRRVKRHPVTQPSDPSYRLIPLTQNQNAIVDTENFAWLNRWNWFASWSKQTKSFYAMRKRSHKGPNVLMHTLIVGCSLEEKCDHQNHDTLDNRKQNLRKCTQSQNCMNRRISVRNTSGYKGVSYRKDVHKWAAHIKVDERTTSLGHFSSAKKAALAYDKAAKIHFKEFACLNFPSP